MYAPTPSQHSPFTEYARKLRALRRAWGLTQDRVAVLSGVGMKTLSSFETGARISTIKLHQLFDILKVYHVEPWEFFSRTVNRLEQRAEEQYEKEHEL